MPLLPIRSLRRFHRCFLAESRGLGGIVLSLLSTLVVVMPVHGATISVTTTADLIAVDGECSLREAVTAANTNTAFSDCSQGEEVPVIDVIELPPGTYSLALPPAGEDANLGGDLDITELVTIRGLGDDFIWWDDPATPEIETLDVYNDPDGFPRTFTAADLPDVVIENSLGKSDQPGDGDRVIHTLQPSPEELGGKRLEKSDVLPITFENLAIARGDDVCSGQSCSNGAAGVFHAADAALVLERIAFFENRSGCLGFNCGNNSNAATIRMGSDHRLEIRQSVLAANRATCADTDCRAGGMLTAVNLGTLRYSSEVSQSLIIDNVQSCSATDCRTGDFLSIRVSDLLFSQNVIIENDISCSAAGLNCRNGDLTKVSNINGCDDATCVLDLQDVEISTNRQTCNGTTCRAGSFLRDSRNFFSQSVQRLRFRDNEQSCTGVGCFLGGLFELGAASGDPNPSMTVDTLEILDNIHRCEGTGCDTLGLFLSDGAGIASISNATVRGESICLGDECFAQPLFTFLDFASISGLALSDSVISCSGASCGYSPVIDVFSLSEPLDPTVSGLSIADSQAVCDGAGCGFGGPADPTFLGEGGLLRFSVETNQDIHLQADGLVLTDNVTDARGTLALEGRVDLSGSTLTGNLSLDGGAIFNGTSLTALQAPGILTLRGSTIDGNEALSGGGGIFNQAGSTLNLIDSTITNNTAQDGGGVFNEGTILLWQNASIESNVPNQCVNSGAGTGCGLFFSDGFESGDTSAWSNTNP